LFSNIYLVINGDFIDFLFKKIKLNRRYKKGYVWQDLLDDDLITPISDNEYVLKGSEIFVPPANPLGT
jgi:hypothetical protein